MHKKIVVPVIITGVAVCLMIFANMSRGRVAGPANKVDKADIRIRDLTDEKIEERINAKNNLYVSDNLYVNIPDTSSFYSYIAKAGDGEKDNYKNYYSQFMKVFKYLFPGHKINDDFLFYEGKDSDRDYDDDWNLIKNYKKEKDYHDKLVASGRPRVTLLYDETPFAEENKWTNRICLELSNPIGIGWGNFNKGNAVHLTGLIDSKSSGRRCYAPLVTYTATDYFKTVGIYSPDSERKFRLEDKTVSIHDAVRFFENYVNNIPYPENAILDIHVVEVSVLQISDHTYGFYFTTASTYDNVPFDTMRAGAHSDTGDYVTSTGEGLMVRSDDVDSLFGYRRTQLMENMKKVTATVPISKAIDIVSDTVTSNIKFNVQKVELVYTQKMRKNEDGSIDATIYPRDVAPAWKFTMRNDNDGLTYVFYVDVGNRKNTRYYTTEADLGVKK